MSKFLGGRPPRFSKPGVPTPATPVVDPPPCCPALWTSLQMILHPLGFWPGYGPDIHTFKSCIYGMLKVL